MIPFLKETNRILPITNPKMTRFNITLSSAVEMVLYALENAWSGELFVPKIPSYNILDLAKAIDAECNTKSLELDLVKKFMKK